MTAELRVAKILRRIRPLRAFAGLVLLAGCQTAKPPRDFTVTAPRFFLEATADGTPLTLPRSDVRVAVNPQPVLTEGDILDVELVQVDLGKCLLFQLTPSAARDFYRLSATHQGRRIVLVVDGAPLGARRLDGPIANGSVFVFVEMDEHALPAFVANLKKSSVALQRELARKG
jgi:hypothetical protein